MQSYQSNQKDKGICRHVERQKSFNKHLLRIIVPAILLVLAFSAPAMALITVDSPTSSDNWIRLGSYYIQWQNPTTCPVNLYICKESCSVDTATTLERNLTDNNYRWDILHSPGIYQIKIATQCPTGSYDVRQEGYSEIFQISEGTPPPKPPEPQLTGSIRVVLSPDEAVNAGAQWQVDGGAWYSSGDVLSNLSEGFHQLAFRQISGWNAPNPNPMSIYVTPSMTTTRTPAPYTKQATPPPTTEYGNLTVIITPPEAVLAGGQWQVDGGIWRNSNTVAQNLSIGQHTVTLKTINGWEARSAKIPVNYNSTYETAYTKNTALTPIFISGSASTPVCIGGQITFDCVWNAPIGHSIEGVKARYRIVGTSGWSNEVFLGYVKNTDSVKNSPQFSGSASISSEGQYEFQFQATDVSTSPASVSQWMQGSGTITVQGECPKHGCVTYPLADTTTVKSGTTTVELSREVIKPPFSVPLGPSGLNFSFAEYDFKASDNANCGVSCTGYHPGTDFMFVGGGLLQCKRNCGQAVYAIADGEVVYVDTASELVVIKHDCDNCKFIIPAKSTSLYSYSSTEVDTVYAVYVHLGEISVGVTEPPTTVKMGTTIGKIGDAAHVHLEIRRSTSKPSSSWWFVLPESNWSNNTYYKDPKVMVESGLIDPVSFIQKNSCNAPQPQSTTLFRSSSTIATSGTDRKAVAMTSASIGTNSFSLYFPSTYTRKKGLRESPSELDLIITTPSGKVLTPDSPEVKDYVAATNKKSYTIDVQETGEWIAEIVAIRVPPEGESYSFEVVKLDGIIDPAIDTDNDGIPDIWEFEHGLNPLINDASTDSDNDGVTNLDEYKAGTDPNDPASKPAPPACACITDGLVACYKFDGNANDGSGNGNDGIAQGSVSYVAGVKGSAVKFGGINSPGDILVKNSASLQFNQGLTISSFVKISDPIGMDGYNKKVANGDHTLVAKSHDRKGLYTRASVNSSNLFDTRGGNNVYSSTPFYFGNATSGNKKDKWVHIAYVIGNGVSKIFLDGVLITPSTGPVDFSIANQQDLYIGKYSDYWYPSGAAMDNLLIYNRALSDAEINQLYTGSCYPEPPTPPVTPGTFTVDDTGTVKIDWLYDGGKYQGEFGIFNLAGMENLTPGSPEFIAEAVKRVMSNSEQGYLAFSDLSEGARFSGLLGGEIKDWNAGDYKGVKSLAMKPGSQFATVLVPNSTFASLAQDTATEDPNRRPLFSLVSADPVYGMHIGQMADVNGMGRAYSYEDKNAEASDWDFNDLIVQITGAVGNIPSIDELKAQHPTQATRQKRDYGDWRDSAFGQMILGHVESATTDPITVTLKGSATLLVYDAQGKVIGKSGGTLVGADFGMTADSQTVTLPNTGDYRIVIQGVKDEICLLSVKDADGNLNEIQVNMAAHQVFATNTALETPAASASYDFNGDGVTDDADVSMLVKHWNSCRGHQKYDAFFDVNDDGCITVADIMMVLNAKTVK